MFKFIIIMVIYASVVLAIPPDDLPFGSYGLLPGQNITDSLSLLHDTLGFNIFWDIIDYNDIQTMADSGITAIRQGDISSDSLYILSYYNYAKIEAEEYESKVRMYNCGGDFSNGLWVSNAGSIDKLYGPNGMNPLCWNWPGHPNKYFIELPRKYREVESEGVIQYTLELSMKIDSVHTASDSIVANLWLVCERWCEARDTLLIDNLTLNDFNGYDDTLITLTRGFVLPETVMCCPTTAEDCENDTTLYDEMICDGAGCSWAMAIIIETTGLRKVSVDYIKIYDDVGKQLVENSRYNTGIIANAQQYSGLGDDLWGWYMQDEPQFSSIVPIGYISSVVRDTANIDWRFITAIHRPWLYGYWFEQGNKDVIMPDIYPFTSGLNDTISYTGFDSAPNVNHAISSYMQNRMIEYTKACSLAYSAASDSDTEFWIIPQCFRGNNGVKWRDPTSAELLCQVNIALASGARGIIFWKYSYSSGPPADYIWGMHDNLGNRRHLWYAVKDNINPYIKAIDSTYLGLTWNDAYTINFENDFAPPDSAWIDTIYAISNDTTPNPDLGWFHVGQFTEGSDKYVMLVNRACSQGENDPTAAPSITATIKFDAAALGLGNYVEIIDIADSVDYISYDSVIVFADTTLASSLGGVITYSTILGPGEGRLFKLASAQ